MYIPFHISRGLVKLKKYRPRKISRRKVHLDGVKLRQWSCIVRKRDKICMSCGSKKSLHAHHIISKYYHPHLAYNLSNGVTLCKSCHIGRGGVHDKRNPPKTTKIAYLRQVFLANRPRKKRRFKKPKKK